jgi:hypothetical protein
LTANITLNEKVLDNGELVSDCSDLREWTPIGSDFSYKYAGTFNGNGHTISGLYYDYNNINTEGIETTDPTEPEYMEYQEYIMNLGTNIGLFGYFEGTIENVGVEDFYFYARSDVGGICGSNYGGKITNSHAIGRINADDTLGGICGYTNGEITYSYAECIISGSQMLGGICGYNDGTLTNIYATGSVSGSGSDIGGICGDNRRNAIKNGYATVKVSGSGSNVGEICGYMFDSSNTNCENVSIENTYYLADQDYAGFGYGSGEAIAKTATEFASGEVCYLLNKNSEEDSVVWKQTIGNSDYPTFSGDIVNAYTATGGKLYGNDGTIKSAGTTVTSADITTLDSGVKINSDTFKNCTADTVVVYVNDGDTTIFEDNVTKKYVVNDDSVGIEINNTDDTAYKFKVVVDTNKYGGSRANGADYLDGVYVIVNETNETPVNYYTEDGDNIKFKVNYETPNENSTVRGQVQVKKWDENKENLVGDIICYVTKAFNIDTDGTIS